MNYTVPERKIDHLELLKALVGCDGKIEDVGGWQGSIFIK